MIISELLIVLRMFKKFYDALKSECSAHCSQKLTIGLDVFLLTTYLSIIYFIFSYLCIFYCNYHWTDSHRMQEHFILCNKLILRLRLGARGSLVGRGTMLKAGRPRVRFPMRSLGFSIHLILPTALWLWG
jgi:hypothetical protein